MPDPSPADEALAAARRVFTEGTARPAGSAGDLGPALVIHDRDGSPVGWFVAVVEGTRILGFVQLDSSYRFLRWSEFPAGADRPEAALWVDPERVRRTARQAAEPSDALGPPMLSYHTTPTRVAWVVPLHRGASELTVYVAGSTAWTEAENSRHAGGPEF